MPILTDDLSQCALTDLVDAEKKINAELARRGRKIGSKKYQLVVDSWNRMAEWHDRLPQVKALGTRRLAHLRKRMDEAAFADGYEEVFDRVGRSPFLRGDRTRWAATFDWVIKNDLNYVKILEGQYEMEEHVQERVSSSQDEQIREMLDG